MPGNYQVWFTVVNSGGGVWNGDPTASPAANVGGIDISLLAGTPMLPTLQGSGDVVLTAFFDPAGFLGPVPTGFTPGWPDAAASGYTTLDPAGAYGSAALSGGNLTATFSTSPGMVQAIAADAKTTGSYYFEINYDSEDVFNNAPGGGIGRDFSVGGEFAHWFDGTFATGDPLGGALENGDGWPSFGANLYALGVLLVTGMGLYAPNPYGLYSRLGVAVRLTPAGPPPVILPRTVIIPLFQIAMPCLPCCPIDVCFC